MLHQRPLQCQSRDNGKLDDEPYDEHETDDLSSTTGLEVEVVNGWNTTMALLAALSVP